MERYYVLDAVGHVIGTVEAVNGDVAWALAQAGSPGCGSIRPIC